MVNHVLKWLIIIHRAWLQRVFPLATQLAGQRAVQRLAALGIGQSCHQVVGSMSILGIFKT